MRRAAAPRTHNTRRCGGRGQEGPSPGRLAGLLGDGPWRCLWGAQVRRSGPYILRRRVRFPGAPSLAEGPRGTSRAEYTSGRGVGQ